MRQRKIDVERDRRQRKIDVERDKEIEYKEEWMRQIDDNSFGFRTFSVFKICFQMLM